MDLKNKARLYAALACALLTLPAALAQSVASAEAGTGLLHDPWQRDNLGYVRRWFFLGPLAPAEAESALAALAPGAPGAGAAGLPWVPQVAWGDHTDVPGPIGSSGMLDGTRTIMALGRATITRGRAGPATLLVGADGALEVYANGKRIYSREKPRPFVADDAVIPVVLNQGANDVVLRLTNSAGPWRVSLRAVEGGSLVPPPAEFTPAIASHDGSVLRVSTDVQASPEGKSVGVDVVAAGGRVVAHQEGRRGEIVRFPTGKWAAGPYEIRCMTSDAWGRAVTVFLPWYQGDALGAARDLVAAAAKEPAGPDGDAVRMLADMVRDRLGDKLDQGGPETWQLIHSPLMEFAEMRLARAGKTGGVRPFGFVRLAFTGVDGSTQYCRAYLPAHYDPARRWPLVISLHGFNPQNPPYVRWWSVDLRHNATAETRDVILIEPHGRGNAQYSGLGEGDVLQALAEAGKRFSVDEDRVYLTGESMGGHGTWAIGSRNAGVFAAIAPVFGGWDFRMTPPAAGGSAGVTPANRWERFLAESASTFATAENLLHVPVLVNHGDADAAVNVEFSRHAVRQLERWGYDIRYQEHGGMGHEDLGMRDAIVDWLLTQRRPAVPRTVRLHAPDLAAARAYWVQVDAWNQPCAFVDVAAEFVAPGLLRLDTQNVAAVTLTPPAALATGPRLTIVWNGERREVALDHGRVQLGEREAGEPSAKHVGFEGQISEVVATPFMVVVGTISPDPQMRDLCRVKAEAFAQAWLKWQHGRPRVRLDTEITEQEQRDFSLILIGGADANRVARSLADRLPLHADAKGITIGDRTWEATDAVGAMIYPNPLGKDRYVLAVAATSATGFYYWNPVLWFDPLGFGTVRCDWYIKDNRRVALAPGRPTAASYLAYGVFDRHWRRGDEATFDREAALQENAVVRRGPKPAERTGKLDPRFAGVFELFPGVQLKIVERDGAVWAEPPGGAPLRLVQESEMEYGMPDNGGQLRFVTDGNGGNTIAIVNSEGRDTPFHRPPPSAAP